MIPLSDRSRQWSRPKTRKLMIATAMITLPSRKFPSESYTHPDCDDRFLIFDLDDQSTCIPTGWSTHANPDPDPGKDWGSIDDQYRILWSGSSCNCVAIAGCQNFDDECQDFDAVSNLWRRVSNLWRQSSKSWRVKKLTPVSDNWRKSSKNWHCKNCATETSKFWRMQELCQ